jgi:hypothetical protein
MGDDDGLLSIIVENKQYFLDLPVQQTIMMLHDNGYHRDYLEQEIERIDARLGKKIKIEISAKITPEQKRESRAEKPEKNGFEVVKKRWIDERTNAWIISAECCGRIAKACSEQAMRKYESARFA